VRHESGSGRFTLVTSGDWDLKTMLPNQCRLSGVDLPAYAGEWINVKKSFHAARNRSLEFVSAAIYSQSI
jgi:hypothetical protein